MSAMRSAFVIVVLLSAVCSADLATSPNTSNSSHDANHTLEPSTPSTAASVTQPSNESLSRSNHTTQTVVPDAVSQQFAAANEPVPEDASTGPMDSLVVVLGKPSPSTNSSTQNTPNVSDTNSSQAVDAPAAELRNESAARSSSTEAVVEDLEAFRLKTLEAKKLEDKARKEKAAEEKSARRKLEEQAAAEKARLQAAASASTAAPAQQDAKPEAESAPSEDAAQQETAPPDSPEARGAEVVKAQRSVNYAAESNGAKLIAANTEAKGAAKILDASRDSYMRNPRDAPRKWVVVELSQEIKPLSLAIANHEIFSSGTKQLQVLGSKAYPVDKWVLLANLVAEDKLGEQVFSLSHHPWVRFVKVRFLSHYGDEHYCTLTSLSVHGVNQVEDLQLVLDGNAGSSEELPEPVSEPPAPELPEPELEQLPEANHTEPQAPARGEPLEEPTEKPEPDAPQSASLLNKIVGGVRSILGRDNSSAATGSLNASRQDPKEPAGPEAVADPAEEASVGEPESPDEYIIKPRQPAVPAAPATPVVAGTPEPSAPVQPNNTAVKPQNTSQAAAATAPVNQTEALQAAPAPAPAPAPAAAPVAPGTSTKEPLTPEAAGQSIFSRLATKLKVLEENQTVVQSYIEHTRGKYVEALNSMKANMDEMAGRQADSEASMEALGKAILQMQEVLVQSANQSAAVSAEARQIRLESWGWRVAEAVGFMVLLWVGTTQRVAEQVKQVVETQESTVCEVPVCPGPEVVEATDKLGLAQSLPVASSRSSRRRKIKKSLSVATMKSSDGSGTDGFSSCTPTPDVIWDDHDKHEAQRRSFS